ncbi:endonuclease/exonuclease/phosphatase family protein [Roseibium sp.]|uniref:endonuclease/exonuclease/phosphatase family protein n=1 Tax=Roseibium sp. TaxID=1936156 RepID=UPI003A9848CB
MLNTNSPNDDAARETSTTGAQRSLLGHWISLVGWMGIAGGIAVCFLGFSAFIAPDFWFTDNMSFFLRQFLGAGICGLVGGLGGLTVSHRLPVLYRKLLLVLAILLITLGGLMMARIDAVTTSASSIHAGEDTTNIRLVSINLENLYLGDETLSAYLDALQADVIVLQETSLGWQKQRLHHREGTTDLTALNSYPAFIAEGRLGDLVIFSRFPLKRTDAITIEGFENGNPYDHTDREILSLTLDVDGRPLNLIAVHPNSPRSRNRWLDRQSYLEAVASEYQRLGTQEPAVILGDWNLSPWSGHFLKILTDNGLTTAFPGGFPQTTRFFFDYRLHWLLGAIVDHVAVSKDIRIDHVELGPPLPTDHLPLVVDLSLVTGSKVNAN